MDALAEFERDLIRECTEAGIAAARVMGRVSQQPSGEGNFEIVLYHRFLAMLLPHMPVC